MNWNEVLALLSVAGFATQRILEILDPLFFAIISFIKKADKNKHLDEKVIKAWLLAIGGFLIGLLIASTDTTQTLPLVSPSISDIIIALAISTGSNAANSLVKYGEYVKESRKHEVLPLPEIKITPTTVTTRPGTQIKFLASVSGTADITVKWENLEDPNSAINDGMYTAPAAVGIYHIAAISNANKAAIATAVITVEQP